MSSERAAYDPPLCGDPDCGGCPTQADLDAYHQRQWDDAGELVYGLLGLPYVRDNDEQVSS